MAKGSGNALARTITSVWKVVNQVKDTEVADDLGTSGRSIPAYRRSGRNRGSARL